MLGGQTLFALSLIRGQSQERRLLLKALPTVSSPLRFVKRILKMKECGA